MLQLVVEKCLLLFFFLTLDPLPDNPPPLVRQAVREKWMFYTLKQGLQGLPETMRRVVEEMGVKILSRQPCIALKFTTNGVQVQLLLTDRSRTVDLLSTSPWTNKGLDVMQNHTGCVLANTRLSPHGKRFTEHLLSMTAVY